MTQIVESHVHGKGGEELIEAASEVGWHDPCSYEGTEHRPVILVSGTQEQLHLELPAHDPMQWKYRQLVGIELRGEKLFPDDVVWQPTSWASRMW